MYACINRGAVVGACASGWGRASAGRNSAARHPLPAQRTGPRPLNKECLTIRPRSPKQTSRPQSRRSKQMVCDASAAGRRSVHAVAAEKAETKIVNVDLGDRSYPIYIGMTLWGAQSMWRAICFESMPDLGYI
eukprot:scaffold314841_cov26-Prasinocladus_malaysianus.AAC.1